MHNELEEEQIVSSSSLYQVPVKEYGESYREHLFEQYKLYIQMADKIGERRLVANRFFLTLNTVLITFLGIVAGTSVGSDQTASINPPLPWVLVVSAAGLVLCFSWYRLVRSYRGLSKAKFMVIRAMEKNLPAAPYRTEREAVGRGQDPKRYLPFTRIETRIPQVLMVLYAGLVAWNFLQAV